MTDYLDTAPCGYFSFSDSGDILRVNQTLCKLLSLNKPDLLHNKVETIFPIATRIFYQTHFFPLLKMHGHAEEIFIFLLAKNGNQVPVLLNASREESDGIAFNNCVCIVVNNRKKFEDELVNAKNRAIAALNENKELSAAKQALLIQSEKLEEQVRVVSKQNQQLSQLNHIATHNLQEPLRKMLLFISIMDNQATTLKQRQVNEKLARSVDVMRDTISGLQQYVWLNELKPSIKEVDLNETIQKIKELLSAEFPEEQLQIEIGDLPIIMADKEQLDLMFYHLLVNAVHYKNPAKPVKILVTSTVVKQNVYKFLAGKYHYGDYFRVEVKDEGIGFDPVQKDSIFELFKKLHHLERKGLGLAFCKLIVENHNGSIEASNPPSGGTCITILLPVNMNRTSKEENT